MKRLMLINVVGLTEELLAQMDWMSAWASDKGITKIKPILPAVTCSMQATYLTGKMPNEHGIVGNGWYNRDTAEVNFWRQSYGLVESPYIWHTLKEQNPDFKVANIGWWFNMYSGADYSLTPRPQYRANGLKIPDCYTVPSEWRDELQNKYGQFPLFSYWGPRTSLKSSEWLATAASEAEEKWKPDLSLVYLPHLDYCLQRNGIDVPSKKDIKDLDSVLKHLSKDAESNGVTVVLVSEYGINTVNQPVHLNRVLRKHGYLAIREENKKELLDAEASKAFAVADHQVAHVYCKPNYLLEVKKLLKSTDGVSLVLDKKEQAEYGLDHDRSGELVVVAKENAWFTYYYWEDDVKAPDFARTVEIHRKPGYDPVELFLDPKLKPALLQVGYKLLKRKLGFRSLLDVIPLDANLVKGSHGAIPTDPRHFPILVTEDWDPERIIEATEVYDYISYFFH